MKFLLEFAKFKDIVTTTDPEISSIIKKDFQIDEELIDNIYIDEYDKNIKLIWNNTEKHSIIKRIKERTSIISISEFNDVVEEAFNEIFPDEIGKTITEGGRYAIHFNNNKFYLIMSINYERLFDDDSEIFIITISPTSKIPKEDIIDFYED